MIRSPNQPASVVHVQIFFKVFSFFLLLLLFIDIVMLNLTNYISHKQLVFYPKDILGLF